METSKSFQTGGPGSRDELWIITRLHRALSDDLDALAMFFNISWEAFRVSVSMGDMCGQRVVAPGEAISQKLKRTFFSIHFEVLWLC